MPRIAATMEAVLKAIDQNRFRVEIDGTCFSRGQWPKSRWKECVGDIVKGPHQTNGYHRVGFTVCGVSYRVLVHRAVWWNFKGRIPAGIEINHIDGDKLNNCLANLELTSKSGNILHAFTTGLIIPAHGRQAVKNRNLRFSEDQIRSIRADNRPQKIIAAEYSADQSDISRIKSRQRYAWVSG